MTSEDELPYAHSLPYWKTSKSGPDAWMDKTIALLVKLGATDVEDAYVNSGGKPRYAITFRIQDHSFRLVWPVLRLRNDSELRAAKVQATTLLYHDCKARCVSAAALGIRNAFVGYLLLENGQTVNEMNDPQLARLASFMPHIAHIEHQPE